MNNIEVIDKARSIINDHERPDVLPLEDIGTISAALGIARIILRRTAEDDKAREKGRLVVLPCKVGDTPCWSDEWTEVKCPECGKLVALGDWQYD